MRGRNLHRPLLGGLLVFLLENCPYNLYQVSVWRDKFNVIIPLISMFAIYMWVITGFWLRLSTAINVFGVSSSQPLRLKKTVCIWNFSHGKTTFLQWKVLQPSSVFQRVVKISSTAWLSAFIYMSGKWAGCSSAQQNRDVDDNLGERAKPASKTSAGSFGWYFSSFKFVTFYEGFFPLHCC